MFLKKKYLGKIWQKLKKVNIFFLNYQEMINEVRGTRIVLERMERYLMLEKWEQMHEYEQILWAEL